MTEGIERHDLEAHAAGVKAYMDLLDQEDGECVCEDCVVREILEAAYPHLRTLVLTEERPKPGNLRAIDLDKVDPTLFTPRRLMGPH